MWVKFDVPVTDPHGPPMDQHYSPGSKPPKRTLRPCALRPAPCALRSAVKVDLSLDANAFAVVVRAEARCVGATGVEMEALTGKPTPNPIP